MSYLKTERPAHRVDDDGPQGLAQLGRLQQSLTATAHHGQPVGDIKAVKANLLRDAVHEALAPISADAEAARMSLANDDDIGARYHLVRVVASVKSAATSFRELEALNACGGGE